MAPERAAVYHGRLARCAETRVEVGAQRRSMRQAANRKAGHHETVEFLPNQIRQLASRNEPGPAPVCL